MIAKRFGNKIIVRLDVGEEIVESIKKIAQENNIKLGQISGIGATNKVKIGLFDVAEKKYYSKELNENLEIAPLSGNISTMKGELYLHLHINLGDINNNSYSGHLNYAYVSATFEGIIDIIDGEIDREFSDEVGLNLFKF